MVWPRRLRGVTARSRLAQGEPRLAFPSNPLGFHQFGVVYHQEEKVVFAKEDASHGGAVKPVPADDRFSEMTMQDQAELSVANAIFGSLKV